VEVFSGTNLGRGRRYASYWIVTGSRVQTVYEAGYLVWLHDLLVNTERNAWSRHRVCFRSSNGNKVKPIVVTAEACSVSGQGNTGRVWVPSAEERFHRQVIRTARAAIGDRVRPEPDQGRASFYGIQIPNTTGKVSKVYLENLHRLQFITTGCKRASATAGRVRF